MNTTLAITRAMPETPSVKAIIGSTIDKVLKSNLKFEPMGSRDGDGTFANYTSWTTRWLSVKQTAWLDRETKNYGAIYLEDGSWVDWKLNISPINNAGCLHLTRFVKLPLDDAFTA